jgi:hypothetical protein
MISAFAIGELGKATQDALRERQVVAEAPSGRDVLLETYG